MPSHVLHAAMAVSILLHSTNAITSQGTFNGITECSAKYSHNMTSMTLPQCYSLCGTGWAPYDKWDAATSILTWVVPLFVLVGNMHFSHFNVGIYKSADDSRWWHATRRHAVNEGRSFLFNYVFVILHLLADPIDSIWSLLDKLATGKKIRSWIEIQTTRIARRASSTTTLPKAKDTTTISIRRISTLPLQTVLDPTELRNLQTTLFALDDFAPHPSSSASTLLALLTYSSLPLNTRRQLLNHLSNTAALLHQTRTQSARRAALAVSAYAYPLFTSVASNRAANSAPTHFPHTIALRELYYWLFPAIALSAAAGAWPTEKTAATILRPLVAEIGRVTRETGLETVPAELALGDLKPWSGAVYTWRPYKKLRGWGDVGRVGAAFGAVAGAWAFSFVMSFVTPTQGLGCRTLTELGYFVIWCASCVVTQGLCRGAERWRRSVREKEVGMRMRKCEDGRNDVYGRGDGETENVEKRLFFVVLIKDAILAIPMTLILFLAFKGWWNSCDCWSARWSLGFANARVPLGLATWEMQHDWLYYAFIGGALGFQVLAAVGMLAWNLDVLMVIYGSKEVERSEDGGELSEHWSNS